MSTSAEHEHELIRQDLAGYVVGGLTIDEQHAVEHHLVGCAACRDELAALDPIPVLLELSAVSAPAPSEQAGMAAVVPGLTGEAPTAPPTEAPVLVTAAASAGERSSAPVSPIKPRGHRRSRSRALVTVGVAVVSLAAAFTIGVVVRPHEAPYSAPVALKATNGSAATGSVAVRHEAHGTDVKLIVQGLSSPKAGTYYQCIWWSDTRQRSAGTFKVLPKGQTEVELVTAAAIEPGWQLDVIEYPGGVGKGVTVMSSPT
jgi:Putative zinc-finger